MMTSPAASSGCWKDCRRRFYDDIVAARWPRGAGHRNKHTRDRICKACAIRHGIQGKFFKGGICARSKGTIARDFAAARLADIVRSGADSGISLKDFRIKAASSAISLSGSAFEDFAAYSRGFLDSLINSAFDTIRAAAVPLPFRQTLVGSPTVAAQVFEVSETTVKSIARISFA